MSGSHQFNRLKYQDKYRLHREALEKYSADIDEQLGYPGAFAGFREKLYQDAR